MWTVCSICGAIAAKYDVHLAWHASRDEHPPIDEPSPDAPIPDAPEASS